MCLSGESCIYINYLIKHQLKCYQTITPPLNNTESSEAKPALNSHKWDTIFFCDGPISQLCAPTTTFSVFQIYFIQRPTSFTGFRRGEELGRGGGGGGGGDPFPQTLENLRS